MTGRPVTAREDVVGDPAPHGGGAGLSPRVRARLDLPAPRRIGAVFAGGVLGGGARIGVALALPHEAGLPWATLLVNVVGALLLGYLLTRLVESTGRPTTLVVPLACTGFLGSFTTFSTFTVETWGLATEAGQPVAATGYVVGSLVLGVLAARVGMHLAER